MKYYFCILSLMLLFFQACSSQVGGVAIERSDTDMPVKIMLDKTKGDSTKVWFLVPQEFKLKNNYSHRIRHSLSFVSITRANIMAENPLFTMEDSLVRSASKTYQSGAEIPFKFYPGYYVMVPNSEIDSLKENGELIQMKYKREVYDIGSLEESAWYLKQKVPDSLRGFIHLDFYNFNTRLGFVENVPIKF